MSTLAPPVLGIGVLTHKLGLWPEPEWLTQLRQSGRIVGSPESVRTVRLINPVQGEEFAANSGEWLCYYTLQDRLVWSPGEPLHAGVRYALETNNPVKVPKPGPPLVPELVIIRVENS